MEATSLAMCVPSGEREQRKGLQAEWRWESQQQLG